MQNYLVTHTTQRHWDEFAEKIVVELQQLFKPCFVRPLSTEAEPQLVLPGNKR